MEIVAGRQVFAPNVWAKSVEMYDATVRLAEQPAAVMTALLIFMQCTLED
jgi:hypothetical protein